MAKPILALDAGTTGVTAIVFDEDRSVHASAYREFGQIYPQPGWVEHDPMEIWSAVQAAAKEVMELAGLSAKQLGGLGITNQRETTVIWDRASGKPIHNALVWQDQRTAAACKKRRRSEKMVRAKTGLVMDSYFSASKIAWILDHVKGAHDKAAAGKLAFGTIDSWLLWQLTNGAVHATDVTNASRTMLWNIHTGHWDSELLELWDIPGALLPQVNPSSHAYGETQFLGHSIPISGIAGDQQAALLGQGCTQAGQAKATYGTGCFILQHTGDSPVNSKHGLITTRAATLYGDPAFALEGSVFVAGQAIQWLRDQMNIIAAAPDINQLAADDSGGTVFVPAFSGLGAPHWNDDASGAWFGIRASTTKEHLARAVLESIAHQCQDVLDVMAKDSRLAIKDLRVDGGATHSDLLMQLQADCLQAPIFRPDNVEATALGAAILAGFCSGGWAGLPDQTGDEFAPLRKRREVGADRKRWARAVKVVQRF